MDGIETMFDLKSNNNKQDKELERWTAICPPSVILVYLNPEQLPSHGGKQIFSVVTLCVCKKKKEKTEDKGSVSKLTSAVQTPHFTASAPLSTAPCSLYAPSLSFNFAFILRCLQDRYLLFQEDTQAPFFLFPLSAAFSVFESVHQMFCFIFLLEWLSVSLLVRLYVQQDLISDHF